MSKAAILGFALLSIVASSALARSSHSHHSKMPYTGEHYTHTYVKHDGTVVQGHWSTNPNHTRNDNYSTIGNVNPHTGEPGTKPRDGQPN